MERRFLLFIVLAFAILWLHVMLTAPKQQPKKPAEVAAGEDGEEPEDGENAQQNGQQLEPGREPDPDEPGEEPGEEPQTQGEEGEVLVEEQPDIPPQWLTLGSADPAAEYRMLVTLTNKGAAVMRTELNSPRYHDLEDRSGYIGHFVVDEAAIDESLRGKGCPVQVVGPGTPAGEAGLLPGDLIKALGREETTEEITGPKDFAEAMEKTKARREITLTIGGKRAKVKVAYMQASR